VNILLHASYAIAAAHGSLASNQDARVLIIASNTVHAGDPDKTDVRNNLWEVAPPYHVFKMHGYEVDFLTPQGGSIPFSLDTDQVDLPGMISYTIKFEGFRQKAASSLKPLGVDARRYAAVFIGGGFGPLFDVANAPDVLRIIGGIYENGGVIGACGHGPGSLSNVKLSNGRHLVAGRKMTGFPNSSEEVSKRSKQGTVLPFRVEDGLRKNGAVFQTKADLPDKHDIVVDERIVTTMFLPSCAIAAKAVVDEIYRSD
jgi:putative intracellular protease/amidase